MLRAVSTWYERGERAGDIAHQSLSHNLDVRAQYFCAGPLGGVYAKQGYRVDRKHAYPTCIPPLACDRPEYAPLLVAHWAYALAIDPRLITIVPTTTYEGRDYRAPDGGFMVLLDQLPLERLRIP